MPGHTPLKLNEHDRKVNEMHETNVILSFEPFTHETFKEEVNKVREHLKHAAKNETFSDARMALLELVTAIDCYDEGDLNLIPGLLMRALEYIDRHWLIVSGSTNGCDARKAYRGLLRIINRWEYNQKIQGEK